MKSEKKLKTKQLNIRISAEDHAVLEKKAEHFGFQNVSEYVRTCSLNAYKFLVEIQSETDVQ